MICGRSRTANCHDPVLAEQVAARELDAAEALHKAGSWFELPAQQVAGIVLRAAARHDLMHRREALARLGMEQWCELAPEDEFDPRRVPLYRVKP